MRFHRTVALPLAMFLIGCGSPPASAPPKTSDSPPPNNTSSQPSGTSNHITISTGIPTKTIAEYTEAIEKNPNEVNSRGELAYQLRGAALAKQGDHDKAIADYTEAIRLYRERKTQYYQIRLLDVFDARATSYRQKGETARAIADYGQIIGFGAHFASPNMMEILGVGGFTCQAYMSRAECYDEMKEPAKAVADYKEAVRMQPSLMTDELRKRLAPAPAPADDTPKADYKTLKRADLKPFEGAWTMEVKSKTGWKGTIRATIALYDAGSPKENFGRIFYNYNLARGSEKRSLEIAHIGGIEFAGVRQGKTTLLVTAEPEDIGPTVPFKVDPKAEFSAPVMLADGKLRLDVSKSLQAFCPPFADMYLDWAKLEFTKVNK